MKIKKYLPTILLIIAAVGLIVVGIALKQPQSVLEKAVKICMECIGIG